MAAFSTFDGIDLFYEVNERVAGPPVLLMHSFGLDAELWRNVGAVDALLESRRTVVSYDARGHGRSATPHDTAAYGDDAMTKDATALLDHLGVRSVDLVSYSMGSQVALRLLQVEPRIRAAVLGGVGARALNPAAKVPPEFADGFEADDPESAPAPLRYARDRADRVGGDRHALAALLRAGFPSPAPEHTNVTAAVLVIIGNQDPMGPAEPLAACFTDGRAVTIEADHASAMEHPAFVPTIVSFLDEGTPPPTFSAATR